MMNAGSIGKEPRNNAPQDHVWIACEKHHQSEYNSFKCEERGDAPGVSFTIDQKMIGVDLNKFTFRFIKFAIPHVVWK